MSEAVAQQTDVKANKRPKFVRQLSKSYEKGKEVMKRNLLTPRGPRTAKSAELPLPDAKAEKDTNTIPQASVMPAEEKAAVGDAQSIKVDIKATHDNSTPVELLVKPAEGAAHEAHEEAASPADGPSAPAIPDLQPETAHVAAPEPKEPEAPAPVLREPALPEAGRMEVAPKEPIEELTDAPTDLGCAPPAVSITFNSPAVKADEAQAAEKPSKAAPAKKGGRPVRSIIIGFVAITAASVAAVHVRR